MNYSDVISVARNQEDIAKVDYILNMVDKGQNKHVPDPYYGGRHGFDNVYDLLDEACDAIADEIEKSTDQ
jgi:protein-tyrosine phosphatase